jgi:hypothetical protein
MPRLCACGCGRTLQGQRSTRRFFSDACRLKNHRRGTPTTTVSGARVAEKRPQPPIPLSAQGGETLTDTIPREVYCAGCGALMAKLHGPVQAPAYCSSCVAQEACPCYNRPTWHGVPQRVKRHAIRK